MLEEENRKLKQLVADLSLDKKMLQDVLSKTLRPAGKLVLVREVRLCYRVDNGPEFISRSLDLWAHFNGVKLDFTKPGKPTDNAVIESFNDRLRDECLNQHWFLSLDQAQAATEAWREDYNRVRPHGALGNRTPSEFARPVNGHAHLPAAHG